MKPPSDAQITIIAETYRLLGDPTRLRVLFACLDGPIAVGATISAICSSTWLIT